MPLTPPSHLRGEEKDEGWSAATKRRLFSDELLEDMDKDIFRIIEGYYLFLFSVILKMANAKIWAYKPI